MPLKSPQEREHSEAKMEPPIFGANEECSGFLGSEIVELIVGKYEERFLIEKKLLCRRIPYFRTIFTSKDTGTLENTDRFPDDDSGAFSILMEWIYDDKLPKLGAIFYDGANEIQFTWQPVSLYCLAEKLHLHSSRP
ncbi:hypothetical protein SBOR_6404 [Sclerotinia borealis F-4128]|uniref:BTB domain-containing protein n=1 Tax=Sclerotinia borealis (strain F-4128) TaxID=1432307 RepID=W9CBL0_SCLBF|nr:hypothetical protein SBOR_6404 [Sclerotinia borealis F-4128]